MPKPFEERRRFASLWKSGIQQSLQSRFDFARLRLLGPRRIRGDDTE
jgi:hypothetical protein